MSSEMDQFHAWLKHHHPELAQRIIGTLVVDDHHLTEDQLLAKAHAFYATAQPMQP
jgi:imidazoleglycerol phosphate dehydratase HisB